MKYTVLGGSGIKVSRICLARKGFGRPFEDLHVWGGAHDVELSAEEIASLEEPYVAHELVGPIARPGEKYLAGTFLRTKQN